MKQVPPWIRRELSDAVQTGNRAKAKRMTKKYMAAHALLHGKSKDVK